MHYPTYMERIMLQQSSIPTGNHACNASRTHCCPAPQNTISIAINTALVQNSFQHTPQIQHDATAQSNGIDRRSLGIIIDSRQHEANTDMNMHLLQSVTNKDAKCARVILLWWCKKLSSTMHQYCTISPDRQKVDTIVSERLQRLT